MQRSSATTTLRDVAREAGVSVMAVSVVLNGATSSARVSPAARARILEVAARLRYRRNAVAHGLSRRRMDALGVVSVVDGGEVNLYFLAVLNGILEAAAERGQNVTVFSVREWKTDEPKIQAFCDGRVDGMILVAPLLTSDFSRALDQCTPYVAVHGSGFPAGSVCNLDVDDASGARTVVRHLIARGHRRIAHFAGGRNLAGAQKRLAGYRGALDEAGIAFDETLVFAGEFSVESGRRCMADLLDRAAAAPGSLPTAVFCASDAIAYGAMEIAAAHGLRVPDDISFAGFDDTLMARMTTPPLTTARQPLRQMGRRAVDLLLARIASGASGEDTQERADEIFPVEMVPRDSVGAPPAPKVSP